MSGVQSRLDIDTSGLKLEGELFDRYPQTIQQDAGRSTVLAQYTVMGKVINSVPATGTATGTGDGTMTAVAASGEPLQIGTYTLTCTFAVTNGGVFSLTAPDGNIVADNLTLRVGAGLLTSFNVAGLVFTITDGATDFVAADIFTVAVTAVDKLIPLDPAGVNGESGFAGIYGGDDILAATLVAGDMETAKVYTGGRGAVLDDSKLVYENSATAATVLPSGKTLQSEMEDKGIFIAPTLAISRVENT